MDTKIFAKSSSHPESPYTVHFMLKDGMLRIHCSCPAGIHGQLCKHKISFIEGDRNMLYDSRQQELLDDVISVINASSLISDYYHLKDLEKIQRNLKKEIKAIKLDLALKLKNGIKLQKA